MLAVQLNIFMVILLSILAIHAYFKIDRKEQAHKTFLILIILTTVILILEIMSVLLNSDYYPNAITAHKLVDTLGFTLAPLVPITAALYMYARVNKYHKIEISFWLSIPFIVNSFISVGSYNFDWIFHITNQNTYVRGPLFFVSPLSSYFYYVISLGFLYDNRKKLTKEELVMLSLLTLIPSVLSGFQLYYFIYLTIWNSTAVAVILNYIYIVHSQVKLDPLTGLGNRLAYNEYLARVCKKSSIGLSVINIDLDDFKSINDVFGHHEGDKVLRFFARQLEYVFGGKGVAIRLGGDEFIVLSSERRREVLEQDISALKGKMNEYNEKNNRPYRINFSCGIAIFNNKYHSIHELIQHSDKLMYEEKQKKKINRAL